jgi:hypothetical protein
VGVGRGWPGDLSWGGVKCSAALELPRSSRCATLDTYNLTLECGNRLNIKYTQLYYMLTALTLLPKLT